MPGRSIRVGRLAGIRVGISPWWLAIVALITWSLGTGFYPEQVDGIAPAAAYALGLLSAVLLFASILAHEFGHALVARRRGVEVEEIDLWLLGGVAKMSGQPRRADDELLYALAGPAVTAVVAAIFGALLLALPGSSPEALRALVAYQAEINAAILIFNLVPAFPLDGGRVMRALIWRRTGNLDRATSAAAGLGKWFGYLLIALGFLAVLNGLAGGLWFALIGFFIVAASGAELMQEQIESAFSGVRVRDLMSSPVVSLPATMTAQEAISDEVSRHRYNAFPVTDEQGRAIGLLTLDRMAATPAPRRPELTAADLAVNDPQLLTTGEEDVADLLHRPAFAQVGRAVVVDDLGRPVGLVSITDVQRALRAARIGGGPAVTSRV